MQLRRIPTAWLCAEQEHPALDLGHMLALGCGCVAGATLGGVGGGAQCSQQHRLSLTVRRGSQTGEAGTERIGCYVGGGLRSWSGTHRAADAELDRSVLQELAELSLRDTAARTLAGAAKR